MSEIKIDGNCFYKKIERVHKTWQNSQVQPKLDILIFVKGTHIDENPQRITSQLTEYLFGFTFTDTLIMFTKSKVVFYFSLKKKQIIDAATRPLAYAGPQIEIIIRNREGGNDDSLQKIHNIIDSEKAMNIGTIFAENPSGLLLQEWENLQNKLLLPKVDCYSLLDEFYSIKDNAEVENMKISSKYSCFIMESLIKKFETIVDQDKKVTHDALSNEMLSLTEKPQFLKKFIEKIKQNVDDKGFSLMFNPIIQSGGKYDISHVCTNNNDLLSSDIVVLKVGANYKDYKTMLTRTFMIDSDKTQQNHYKILYETFQFLVSKLTENSKHCNIYNDVVDFLKNKSPDLVSHLPETFSQGIGFESFNQIQVISKNNNYLVKSNTVYLISLSLRDLVSEKGLLYTLQLSDIVNVTKSQPETLTKEISKSLNDVLYNMEEEEEDENAENRTRANDNRNNGNGYIKTRNSERNIESTDISRRKDHQKSLLDRKNREFEEKLRKINTKDDDTLVLKKNLTSIKCYNSKSQFPQDLKANKISVDSRANAILLPVFGMMVPFHVSLVKNISLSDEAGFSYLRINFNVPNPEELQLQHPVLIREFVYKSTDAKSMESLNKSIKDLIKKSKTQDKEDKDRQELVTQENLTLLKGKRVALTNVTIRPNILTTKTSGVLEAHQNGLRFISSKNDKIDIIYKNIKHAVFQPCDGELIVLVHFHLKSPIMLGKKKQNDVQFFREIGIQADDLGLTKKGNDMEEYESELREKQMIDKMNEEFKRFCQTVEQMSKIDFDTPIRELGFHGVPFKSLVTLLPNSYSLASLIDLPFFLVSLDDFELVHFERVQHNIKTFDMVIVFKDLNRQPHRITSIPIESLEDIKNWLDSCDILFSEGPMNLKWPKVIGKIKDDPEKFIQDGGWSILQDDSSEEDEGDHEDSSFHESEYSEGDDDSEYGEEEEEIEDSEVSGGDSELSDQGLSWDELENEAAKMDRENNFLSKTDNSGIKQPVKKGKK